MTKHQYLISIITVTRVSYSSLLKLAMSLEHQLSEYICWVIKDSGECSETIDWAYSQSNPHIYFYSQVDSGIYEALNQALSMANSDFYVVAGADDVFYNDSLVKLQYFLHDKCPSVGQVFVFPVHEGSKTIKPIHFWPKWISVRSLVSSHSVGSVFPTSIHITNGLYDQSYKILADSLFIMKLYNNGITFIFLDRLILGRFSTNGISRTSHALRLVEAFNYNTATGSPIYVQAMLLAFRLIMYNIYRLEV